MRPRLSLALSILCFATGFSSLEAESDAPSYYHRAWQTEDGLPDNSVTGVAQDPDGYLWIGTKGGVMRFNGIDFSPLPLSSISEVPSREVRAMFLDRLGRLWFSLERGPVIRIDKDSHHVFTYEKGISPEVASSITDDPDGRLWIAYKNLVCLIDGEEVTQIETDQWFPNPGGASIACDTAGQVWLANGGRLGRLGNGSFELVRDFGSASVSIAPSLNGGIWIMVNSELMLLKDGEQLVSMTELAGEINTAAILEDRDQAVWIGTLDQGLFRFKDGIVQNVSTSFHSVDCLTEDRDGNLWAGTLGGGLNLIKPRVVELIGKSDGLPFTSVRSATRDASGKIWALSQTGRLAFQEEGQWYLSDLGNESDPVNCVTADSEGVVWIGTRGRGLLRVAGGEVTQYDQSAGLAGRFVRSLLAAKNGDLWIATDRSYALHRLRNGKILQIDHSGEVAALRAIAEGADGTIWIGSSDGRLLRVVDDQLIDEEAVEDIPSIRTLHATSDGSLWIGYAGEGLGHLKEGRYSRITTDNGLFDDYISQIQDDGMGSLWIAANRGLFQVRLDEIFAFLSAERASLRCRAFGRGDGLPSFQPSRDYAPDSFRGQNNRIYFSTSNGLVEVRPDRTSKDSRPPPVVLEKVTVDGSVMAIQGAYSMQAPKPHGDLIHLGEAEPKLTLPPGHDRIVINFASLSLGYPENQYFLYRLNPLVSKWEDPDDSHRATFTRLPAGSYKFEVIACNSYGVWNKVGASLDIVVQPFFWQTWWFKIGGGVSTALAAGGLVFLGLKRKHRDQLRRILSKRALEQERSRIARDIHDDLGASLTRISLLSQSPVDPVDGPTSLVLQKIQKTARHLMRSMDGVVWAINPEHDNLDDLANYLSSYAQEFLSVAGVSCRLEMPVELPNLPLSAQLRHNLFLAFKEALNNVVKYAAANEVRISLQSSDKLLLLRICDNGRGIDPEAPADPRRINAGSGLVNMESRMEEIGGTCILESTPGRGTALEFRVPITGAP